MPDCLTSLVPGSWGLSSWHREVEDWKSAAGRASCLPDSSTESQTSRRTGPSSAHVCLRALMYHGLSAPRWHSSFCNSIMQCRNIAIHYDDIDKNMHIKCSVEWCEKEDDSLTAGSSKAATNRFSKKQDLTCLIFLKSHMKTSVNCDVRVQNVLDINLKLI